MTDLDPREVAGRREDPVPGEDPDATMRRREFLARTAALAGAAGLATVLPVDALVSEAARVQTPAGLLPAPRNMPIDTIVVLMMENRSFDHYFGWRADADGKNAGLTYLDDQGQPHSTHPLAPDYQGCGFADPDHSWEGGRIQYDGGKLKGFRRGANDDYALGYYRQGEARFLHPLASAFTLYDRYFCSLLGPTWPNREYMHSAQSGGNKQNASAQDAANAYNSGGLYRWETIWDRLLQRGISCAYYYSDLPFIAIFGKRYQAITKPVSQYYSDAAAGRLPRVVFVDPPFLDGGGGDGLSGDEHPHGDIRIGQAFMSDVVHAFMESPHFRRGALFVNYDEWGGFFDHVRPRLVPDDRQSSDLNENFGLTGFRIPGVAVSPYARRHYVSHTTVTHESILKLITYRFGLGYLNKRHRYASNIGRTFDWNHPNFNLPPHPSPQPPATTPCSAQLGARAQQETLAHRRQELSEGLSIGDPRVVEYVQAQGYAVEPATPERIFRNPGRAAMQLGELWQARARSGEAP
jgi:phospholipase C